MNNEPVAYKAWHKDLGWTYHDWKDGFTSEDVIPLYTHPHSDKSVKAKTLTDGIDLLEKYADKLEDERPNKGLSDVVYECVAILRKAREK